MAQIFRAEPRWQSIVTSVGRRDRSGFRWSANGKRDPDQRVLGRIGRPARRRKRPPVLEWLKRGLGHPITLTFPLH